MKQLIISSIFWGDYYKNFVDFAVPSLLTRGNLNNPNIKFIYYICTDDNSWTSINKNVSFLKLKKLGEVIHFPFSKITAKNIPEKVNQFTAITINEAYKKKFIHFLVAPDSIFSKNYLLRNLQILGDKIDCIASPGSRVMLGSEVLDGLKNFKIDEVIEVPSNELAGLAIKFQHKWAYLNEIDSPYRSHFSSGITLTDKNKNYRLSIGHKTTPILFLCKKEIDYKKIGSIDFALPCMITHPKRIYLPKNSLNDEFHYGLDEAFSLQEGVHFVKEKLTILNFVAQWKNKYFSGEEYLLRQIVTEVTGPNVLIDKKDFHKIKTFQYLSLVLIFIYKIIRPFLKLKLIYIYVSNLIKKIIFKLKRIICKST